MQRLASYDTSKPTEVTLSFSDSDDEQSLEYDGDRNNPSNDIKLDNGVRNSDRGTNRNQVRSEPREPNNKLDNAVRNSNRGPNKNQHRSESRELNNSNVNTLHFIDNENNLNESNISKDIDPYTIKNRKRKRLDENDNLETKTRRHSESSAILSDSALILKTEKVEELCNNNPSPEIQTQKSPSSTNKGSENTNKLLGVVSLSLLQIIEAFSEHSYVQNTNQARNQIDKSMSDCDFLRFKYQKFKLCFVSVDNIIVPNVDNDSFIRQFVRDTIKLSSEKRIVCSQRQIEVILQELIMWTADKKKTHGNTQLTIDQILETHRVKPTDTNHNLLRKQLEERSKPPPYPEGSSWVCTSGNTMNNLPNCIDNSNMTQPIIATANNMSLETTNNNSVIQTDYGVMSKNITTVSANRCPVKASNNTMAIINNGNNTIPVFDSPVMSSNHCHVVRETNNYETDLTPSMNSPLFANNNNTTPANVSFDNAAYNDIENNDLAKNDMAQKRKGNVIFSSGPPGQEVSITVHPKLIQQIQQKNVNFKPNNTSNSQECRKPPSLPQQRIMGQLPPQAFLQQQELLPRQQLNQQQLSEQQLHQQKIPQQKLPKHLTPQQELSQQELPQKQLPQQQLHQQQLPQQHLLQQQLPQQRLPQKCLPRQQLSQQQWPQQQLHQQISSQQRLPEHLLSRQYLPQQLLPQQRRPGQNLPLQSTLQQYLPQNHTTNNPIQVPWSNDPRIIFNNYQFTQHPPSSYHCQNALPQNKESLHWQHQSKMVLNSTYHNQNMLPHFLPPHRPEQNEQRSQTEIIRSSSNDSGFTSPLHFNSPTSENLQVILINK